MQLTLSNSGSTTIAFFLAAIIVATIFGRATIANPTPGPTRDFLPNVRRDIANGSVHLPVDEFFRPAIAAVRPISNIPPDSCLFYSYGLHDEAKTHAKKKNLLTIWDMYPNHTFPQLQNFTDRERDIFYRFLDSEFVNGCSGIGWCLSPRLLCPDSMLFQVELADYNNDVTGLSGWINISPPYNGSDFIAAGDKAVVLPDLEDIDARRLYCSNPRRFSGTDPHNYWGN